MVDKDISLYDFAKKYFGDEFETMPHLKKLMTAIDNDDMDVSLWAFARRPGKAHLVKKIKESVWCPPVDTSNHGL